MRHDHHDPAPPIAQRGHRALRCGRVSIPGQIYLLTTVTAARRRAFKEFPAARIVCQIVHARATWGDANLLAWVLMPDHWHGMVQLGNEPLPRVMNRFKALATQALRRQSDLSGPLWERGFHDHAVRRDEDVRAAARYIVANPVRAGLATSTLFYPYWNAVWLDPDKPDLHL